MCPFDVTFAKAMTYFEVFLPTYDVQKRKETTYQLWFEEFMSFWKACYNSPPWEPVSVDFLLNLLAPLLNGCFQSLVALYSRLADNNIGCIDWEPYIPMFFAKIQNNFNLPVTYKKSHIGKIEEAAHGVFLLMTNCSYETFRP